MSNKYSLTLMLATLAVVTPPAQGSAQLTRVRRVVNGDKASIKEFPFYVTIRLPYHGFCGGSIITNRWLLTAGHCVTSNSHEDVIVQVGSDDQNRGQDYGVDQIIVHPRYHHTQYLFDYALLRLKKPLKFNSRVSRIELGRSGDLRKGAVGTLVGRGFSHEDYAMKDYPQTWHRRFLKAQLAITDMEKCEEGKRDENNTLPERLLQAYRKYTICSLSEKYPPQSSCNGDSGGPFIVNGRLAGVVSEGFHREGCKARHSGAIVNSLASVPPAARWILRETRRTRSPGREPWRNGLRTALTRSLFNRF